MPIPVERWIVCYTGRHQEGRYSGIENIQAALHQQCLCKTSIVMLKSWRDSVEDLASRMWYRRPDVGQPRVCVLGFSYGGYTATLLADEIYERFDWEVEVMILIDPVARLLDRWPTSLSYLPWWSINLSDHVNTCWHWYQKTERLRGHRVKHVKGKTVMHPRELQLSHSEIDDAPEIFNRAMLEACPEHDGEILHRTE